jgi:lipopolysaccharide export system permease protein
MQFLMQTLPRIAGKELPWGIIFEMIGYSMTYMVALAVPMSVLVATLMCFSKLVENRAWMVLRNAGVSLLQVAMPLALVVMMMAAGMWYFDNEILPEAMYQTNTLQYSVQDAKPSLALDAGKFYNKIKGYTLFVKQKALLNDELRGVFIFDDHNGGNKRATLVAEKGTLRKDPTNAKKLVLSLENGELHRYQSSEPIRYERIKFGQYKTTLDISDLGFKGKAQQGFRGDRTTPSSRMMRQIDSMYIRINDSEARLKQSIEKNEALPQLQQGNKQPNVADTLKPAPSKYAVLKGLTLKQQEEVFSRALQIAQQRLIEAEGTQSNRDALENNIANYWVEVYKKRSMALACVLFLLLGMPLGLRIQRGGLGIVVAISGAVFAIFWTFLVLGEKLADNEYISPILAMWTSSVLFGIVAISLILKEMTGRFFWNFRRPKPRMTSDSSDSSDEWFE